MRLFAARTKPPPRCDVRFCLTLLWSVLPKSCLAMSSHAAAVRNVHTPALESVPEPGGHRVYICFCWCAWPAVTTATNTMVLIWQLEDWWITITVSSSHLGSLFNRRRLRVSGRWQVSSGREWDAELWTHCELRRGSCNLLKSGTGSVLVARAGMCVLLTGVPLALYLML